MCPACLMSAALIAGGATAGGGTAALIARRILQRRRNRPAPTPAEIDDVVAFVKTLDNGDK